MSREVMRSRILPTASQRRDLDRPRIVSPSVRLHRATPPRQQAWL